MTDLIPTIIAKSDQLNSDDLIGGPRTITVAKVELLTEDQQPVAIHFEGDQGKPYKPCKSMRRVMVQCWGGDGNAYAGRSMTLYRDPDVIFGGVKVGGTRISHMSDIKADMTLSLTDKRASKRPFQVKKLASIAAHPELVEAGAVAASLGVEGYTAWLKTLPKEEKETIRSHHADWSTIAKQSSLAAIGPGQSKSKEWEI